MTTLVLCCAIALQVLGQGPQNTSSSPPQADTTAQWILIIVTAITAGFICWQAWETRKAAKAAANSVEAINRQAGIMERQTKAAETAAEAALLNAQSVINSERAWIDGEVIKRQIIGLTRYSLNMKNHGRTPAQILSYEISHGLLTKGVEFSAQNLSTRFIAYDYVLLASAETRTLMEDFDMDDLFKTTSEEMNTGAFSVTIKYGDVVSGDRERQEGHETSFVYYYNVFFSTLERISIYNKYT